MRYFKQYGCKRTGTNYLRALIEKNFTNVTVLMHTLGGKHEHPVDLKTLWTDHKADPVGFVAAATQAYPAESTSPFNAEQIAFIQNNADAITEAVLNDKIHYLISIKNPYAWMNSNKDPYSWINENYRNILLSHGGDSDSSKLELLIKLKSHEFNAKYRSFMELSKKFPDQTTIVRYEDLVVNPDSVLNEICQRLQLTQKLPSFSDIAGKAVPTVWDQQATYENKNVEFSKDYYLNEKFMDDLSTQIIDILESEIDWELMKNYHYHKRH